MSVFPIEFTLLCRFNHSFWILLFDFISRKNDEKSFSKNWRKKSKQISDPMTMIYKPQTFIWHAIIEKKKKMPQHDKSNWNDGMKWYEKKNITTMIELNWCHQFLVQTLFQRDTHFISRLYFAVVLLLLLLLLTSYNFADHF